MNPRFLKTVLVVAALVMSVAANAATPLGETERREDNDPIVKSKKVFNVTIKHNKPVAFKRTTAELPKHFLAHAKKNVVQAKKGGAK